MSDSDDGDRPTLPDAGRKVRAAISRQDAKRMRNLHMGEIARMTDGRDRAYHQMAEDLQRERTHKANAFALLEACVRRYGTLNFDYETVTKECARGRVRITALPNEGRITVRHLSDLSAIVTVDNSDTASQNEK